jgi:hypothetical protein
MLIGGFYRGKRFTFNAMSGYFSYEELTKLKALEGKTLQQVTYYNWQNKVRPEEIFGFLDKLEMKFSDGTSVVLSGNEEDEPGIILIPDFDLETTRLMLLHEFGGRIDIASADMTQTTLWAGAAGQVLQLVGLVDDGENSYRNDAIMLDFGEEKLEISPAMEGLFIEPYEEV